MEMCTCDDCVAATILPRFPQYIAGMSITDYVRRYEIMNHLKPTV